MTEAFTRSRVTEAAGVVITTIMGPGGQGAMGTDAMSRCSPALRRLRDVGGLWDGLDQESERRRVSGMDIDRLEFEKL